MARGVHSILILAAAIAGFVSGCARIQEIPRARLGALPFPGATTLFSSCGPADVGTHHYAGPLERPLSSGEGARGIVYTCRAGFLDMAHLRETVDWTWYLHARARELLVQGGGVSTFTYDKTDFELSVSPPATMPVVPVHLRRKVLDEAAIRIGQRAAYFVQTWHEIESWYGLRTVFFVPEDRSAFTWDDSTSHLVGMEIAARIIRSRPGNYDDDAAAEIRRTLEDLGAVPASRVEAAAMAVSMRWWSGNSPLKRDLDTGLASGRKAPWLVPGFPDCGDPEPAELIVPSLRDIHGFDLTGMFELRLTPRTRVLKAAEIDPQLTPPLHAERDIPIIIDRIRSEMVAKWGPDVGSPYTPPEK
jgi:hypothetical protein